MKKLNEQQIKAIREILLNQKGEVKQDYHGKLEKFFNGGKIRTWNIKRYHKSELYPWVFDLMNVVEICGYKVQQSNDSARDGKAGEYLQLVGKNVEFNEKEFFNLIKG